MLPILGGGGLRALRTAVRRLRIHSGGVPLPGFRRRRSGLLAGLQQIVFDRGGLKSEKQDSSYF